MIVSENQKGFGAVAEKKDKGVVKAPKGSDDKNVEGVGR